MIGLDSFLFKTNESSLQISVETGSDPTDSEANLDVLSLAAMQVASVLAVSFLPVCGNSVQQTRKKQCYSTKKTELRIDSPCCGKGKLSTEQSTRPENLIMTNTKPLPSLKVWRRNKMQYGGWTIQWEGNKQICIYSKELHYSKNDVFCIL